jgi:ribosomal protein L37E
MEHTPAVTRSCARCGETVDIGDQMCAACDNAVYLEAKEARYTWREDQDNPPLAPDLEKELQALECLWEAIWRRQTTWEEH